MTDSPDTSSESTDEQRLLQARVARLEAAVAARDAEIERLEAAVARAEPAAQARLQVEVRRLRTQGRLRALELRAARRELVRRPGATPAADGRLRELEQLVSSLVGVLEATREDVGRVAGSRAWRWGHAQTRLASRLTRRRRTTDGALVRALERIERAQLGLNLRPSPATAPPRAPAARAVAPEDREAFVERVRARLGPPPHRDQWPGVSAVLLAPAGPLADHPLLRGLRATTYPALQLVVVGDAAGTPDLPFDVVAVPGTTWAAGAAAAEHDLLLLLASGIEPVDPDWVHELVATASGPAAATVASAMVVEAGGDDPAVLQRAVAFRQIDGVVEPYAVGGPLTEVLGDDRGAPVASCLLVPRDALDACGGLDPDLPPGAAEVDLGLRLAAAGLAVVSSGRTVVAGTPDAVPVPGTAAHRELRARWGPRLRREYRLRRLDGDPSWTDGAGPHAGVPADRPALRAALAARGWRVTEVAGPQERPADLDYLVVSDPAADLAALPHGLVRVAALETPPARAWLADVDLLLATGDAAAAALEPVAGRRPDVLTADARELVTHVRELEERLAFGLKVGAPDVERAARGGDLHFARALGAGLRGLGHRVRIQTFDRWDADDGLDDDVVVHLAGRGRYHPRPGQLNVLWCISHPGDLTVEQCDGYDLVCVASARFADELRGRTRAPVVVLEQATDPAVFHPDPDPALARELAYVANSRGILRPILRDLLPTDRDLGVWGSRWEGLIDTRHVVADHVANDDLRRVYSSARVVLADHWEDMTEHGFIGNRIPDALACGALVVSDAVAGLDGRFGPAVRTYRTPEELEAAIAAALGDEDRDRHVEQARATVLAEWTFERRAAQLLEAVERQRAAAGFRQRIIA